MRNVLTIGLCGSMMVLMAVSSQAQLIIAHRGASFDAPENTLAAFKLAWEQKADGIEGDFYLTRDGKIVCFHDKTTKRTAAGKVDLDVASSTLAELRKLDVGAWKDPKYAGEPPPTLEEVLAVVPAGKVFFIEIKCGAEIVPALERTLAKSPVPAENLRIISFNSDVIARCNQRMPKIKTQWLTDYKQDKQTGEWRPGREAVVTSLKETKADGLGSKANFEMLTPALVSQLKGMGLEVGAWTVDKPEDARRLMGMGVTAITTNRPQFIREQLGR